MTTIVARLIPSGCYEEVFRYMRDGRVIRGEQDLTDNPQGRLELLALYEWGYIRQ